MTAQKDQIQALIAEIDGVLQRTTPRLPWVVSGDAAQQRQLLERVRNYLVATQRQLAGSEGPRPTSQPSALLTHDLYYQTAATPETQTPFSDVGTQQMMQMLLQEMSYLRTHVMQPLQSDLELLRQQRDALAQEVQQLEAQRQTARLGQASAGQQQLIGEFLQVLMGRLQEALAQQMTQTLNVIRSQALPQANSSLLGAELTYHPQLEQIQALQMRSDQMLVNLDATLQVVFESLQQNIQIYQDSLAQGVDRMHALGQQSEVLFAALVNQLAQQLGREASSYLQSSAPTLPARPLTEPLQPSPSLSAQTHPSGEEPLPYAGVEMQSASASPALEEAISAPLSQALEVDATWSTTDSLDLADLQLSPLQTNEVESLLDLEEMARSTSPSVAELSTESSEPFSGLAEDTEDIDAALKLLEQLSNDLRDQSPVADGPEQPDAHLTSAAAPADSAQAVFGSIDDESSEVDEFYQSLFGATSADPTAEQVPDQTLVSGELSIAIEPGLDLPEAVLPLPSDQETAISPALESEAVDLDSIFDDRFIPASPEEDLMPIVPAESDMAEMEFALDETILNRLNEDLFNLEITSDDPFLAFEGNSALAADALGSEITLANWADQPASASPVPSVPEEAEAVWDNLSLEDFSTDVIASTAAAPVPTSEGPPPSVPDSANQFEMESPFTLEGMDDLFADAPIAAQRPASPAAPDQPSLEASAIPFTLERMESLFEDVPAVQPTEHRSGVTSPAPTIDNQLQALTLEGMDDLFGSAEPLGSASPTPLASSVPAASDPSITLEGIDNWFADVPPVEDLAADRPTENWTLGDAEGLFPDATPVPSRPADENRAPNPDELSLEEAFESLLGFSSRPPAVAEGEIPAQPQPPQVNPKYPKGFGPTAQP